MGSHAWRRFLPPRRNRVVLEDGRRLTTIRSIDESAAFAEEVRALGSHPDPSHEADRLHTLLLAQTPRAVLAQQQMDTHPHGYHNREKRLYELIDFNDTLVAYVLATPHAQLPGLADRLWADMTTHCRRLKTPMFSRQQFDAIVLGLGREIAVYRSATFKGFKVRMTNRTEDAFGIDMVITQAGTDKVLNIDCKTPPAFRHRLEELAHHGRISDDDIIRADEQGYLTLPQRRGNETVDVTLFCILPDRLGDIHDFTFDQPERLERALNDIFATV